MQNWNKNQMKVYFVRKELFKKFFSTGQEIERNLCSNFARTIFLWMDEKYSKEFWKKNPTLIIICQFIDDLRAI